jgi:hypothetical protein
MTLHEVKQYYGKSYRKIIDSLKVTVDTFLYEVDKSCGKYLELECKEQNNRGRWLKVNHGISNQHPYNAWYKAGRWEETERKRFASQNEVAEYIKSIF